MIHNRRRRLVMHDSTPPPMTRHLFILSHLTHARTHSPFLCPGMFSLCVMPRNVTRLLLPPASPRTTDVPLYLAARVTSSRNRF